MLSMRVLDAKKLVATALLVGGIGLWAAVSGGLSKDQPGAASGITKAELDDVSQTNAFFGHQSVGANILDGVARVYSANGAPAPAVIELGGSGRSADDAGVITHAFIGENEKPLLKIQDFAAKLRSGVGESVDVAMMKFCYVDITSNTNVDEVFASYRSTVAELQREFPRLTLVHATVPLTTPDQGVLGSLKSWFRGQNPEVADNVVRERFNALVRNEYGGSNLFDLAAVESTAPDGTRVGGRYHEQPYYELYHGYASDNGHLNDEGAQIVAAAWLKAIANVNPR